jgi:TonB-linked SusC/RagA family outer membrane protein
MKKTLLLPLIPLASLVHPAVAQTRTVSGRITDRTTNEGLPGATVLVKGTTAGVSTNSDGTFTLNVPAGATTLLISSVGYSPIERTLGNEAQVTIALAPDSKQIGEVVVTGYGGSQDIKDITGSYAKIDQTKLTSQPVTSADQALAGRVAGVQITNSSGTLGDAVAVRVRGINSITGSSQPLFVIDGVPMTEFGNFNLLSDGIKYNPLADINPNDIESMTVLKDASAAAIYGSRAANGVILITTKRGRSGQSKLTFNTSTGFMEATRVPKMLNGGDFKALTNEKYANRFPNAAESQYPIQDGDFNGDGQVDETNWIDRIFRKGLMQDYQAALSGGSDKGTYYASVGYSDMRGSIISNRLRRANARLNLEMTPKTWLKAGIVMGYSHAYNQGILTDKYLAGATVAAYNAPPNLPIYDATGWYYLDPVTQYLGSGNNQYGAYVQNRIFHPLAHSELQRNNNTQRRLLGNGYLTVTPLKGLSFTSKYGIDYINNYEDQYSSPHIADLGSRTSGFNGLIQLYRADNTLFTWQNYASYSKLFGENHNLELTAGVEQNQETYDLIYTPFSNFVDPDFTQPYQTSVGQQAGGASHDVTGWQSFFGRANYAFSDKYYATFTARYDASSRFGINNRYGFFPGASVGWRISQEEFLKSFSLLNDLKLRASYGLVGNSAGIGSYASATQITGQQYASFPGIAIEALGNPSLGWETSKKADIGFDLSAVNNRIGVVFDYFSNNIDNLLLSAPASLVTGIPTAAGTPASSLARNVGKMYNRGFEFTVNTTNFELPSGFKWTSSLNYSRIKNKITELTAEGDITASNSVVYRGTVGRPIGSFKILRWAGVNPDNGNAMFYDKDDNIRQYDPAVANTVDPATGNTRSGWTYLSGEAATALSTASDGVFVDAQGFPKWFGGFDNTFGTKACN